MRRNFTREELSKMTPIKTISQLAIDAAKISRPLSEQVLTSAKNTFPIKQAPVIKPIFASIEPEVAKKVFVALVQSKTETHIKSAASDHIDFFKKQKEVELTQEQLKTGEQDIKLENLNIENQRLKSALKEKDLLLSDKNSLITKLLEENQSSANQLFVPTPYFNTVNELIESEEEKDDKKPKKNSNDPIDTVNLTVDTIESEFVCYDMQGITTVFTRCNSLIGELQENGSIE